jgi:hypothetical protein
LALSTISDFSLDEGGAYLHIAGRLKLQFTAKYLKRAQIKVEYGQLCEMAAAFGASALQKLRRSDLCTGLKYFTEASTAWEGYLNPFCYKA